MKKASVILLVMSMLLAAAACSASQNGSDGELAITTAVTTGTRPPEDIDQSIAVEESSAKISDYEGRWVCGKCMIDIAEEEDGIGVDIIGNVSAAEYREWHYNCIFNGRFLFSDRAGESSMTVLGEF